MNVLHSFYPLWFKKRVELGIPASAFLIITVGRLDANKNVGTIIKALDQLNKSMAHVIVCGDGEEMAHLKAQIKENHLQQQIQLLGSRTDMKELYQTSNCFALASYREGLSRSIMEAMACGLPCVVSHIRGNVDLISDGEEGYLCDPRKPEEFAKAISKLLENVNMAKKISCNCRKKVEQFNVLVAEKRMEAIYKTEIVS